MMVVAAIGLVANLGIIHVLRRSENLNVRSAVLHVSGDTGSSVAVQVGGAWIALAGQVRIDPVLSRIIAVLIVVSAARLLREMVGIPLQFTPSWVDFDDVVVDMTSVPGMGGVHHVHFWSLSSEIHVLDANVYSCE